MKEHAKKALKHDFKVAGKTVPTLALVALFLVGTGSAALLSSFGTVSGEANVNAILTMGDQVENSFEADYADATGGEELIAASQTFNNHGEEPVQVSFTATETVVDSEGDEVTSNVGSNTETSFVLYSQRNVSGEDYAVSVNPVIGDSVQNGEYATEISSGSATSDYAKVWYDVPDSATIGSSNMKSLKYYADATDSEVPGADEVYILTEDGEMYVEAASVLGEDSGDFEQGVDHTDGSENLPVEGTVEEDLTDSLVDYDLGYGTQMPSGAEIAAIGLGYGDGDANTEGRKVDVTVDNVRLVDGDSDIVQLSEDESDVSDIPVFSTGEDKQYQFQSVTSLDTAFYTEGGNKLQVNTTASFAGSS